MNQSKHVRSPISRQRAILRTTLVADFRRVNYFPVNVLIMMGETGSAASA